MLKGFDGDSDTPELIWDSSTRSELRSVLGDQLDACIARRKEGKPEENFSLEPSVRVRYSKLDNELYIGGVYVSRFVKEPTFSLRDPTTFLELLLQRWAKELELYTSGNSASNSTSESRAITAAGQDVLHLVTTASVYLCKVHDSLCDKLAHWGYMPRSLHFLRDVLHRDLEGTPILSIIRLLHVAANRAVNVEALALVGDEDGKEGVVDFTLQAVGYEKLHPDSAFIIEALKKVFEKAVGDVKRIRKAGLPHTSSQPNAQETVQQSFLVKAPSPAPGEGPVRKKVVVGNDPLAMMQPIDKPQPETHQSPAASTSQLQYQSIGNASFHKTADCFHQQGNNMYPGFDQGDGRHAQPSGFSTISTDYSATQWPLQPAYSSQSRQVHQQQTKYKSTKRTTQQHGGMFQTTIVSPGLGGPARSPAYYQPAPSEQRHSPYPSQAPAPAPATSISSQTYPLLFSQQQQHPSDNTSGYNQSQGLREGNYLHQPLGMNTRTEQLSVQHSYHCQEQAGRGVDQSNSLSSEPRSVSFLHTGQSGQYQPAEQPTNHQMLQGGACNTDSSSQQGQGQQPVEAHGPSEPFGSYHPGFSASWSTSNAQGHSVGQDPFKSNTFQQRPDSYEQFGQRAVGAAAVETVLEPTSEVSQYRPLPVEGTCIDARSQEDPKTSAEQQAQSTDGAPGAAHGRVALLQQAVMCKLCDFLVDIFLENPGLEDIKDPAAAKVNAIDLLKLLAKDPGYGPKFKIILDSLPNWKKYKSQDHSLLITGHEQRADYFLTDGGVGETKLLTRD